MSACVKRFLLAQRCANAVHAVVLSVCLSVCLSQIGVLSKRLNGSSCFYFSHRGCALCSFVSNSKLSPFFSFSREARQPSQVYHTERPLLFTTRWAWRSASRGFICDRWDYLDHSLCDRKWAIRSVQPANEKLDISKFLFTTARTVTACLLVCVLENILT